MYLLDIEDFYNAGVCGDNMTKTTPTQWEDVFNSIRALIDSNFSAFRSYYTENYNLLPESPCKQELNRLYNSLKQMVGSSPNGNLKIKVQLLESALRNNNFDECNHSQWNDYMTAYKQYVDLQKEIAFLFDYGCDNEAHNLGVSVDMTTITDTKSVTTKCNGIYMSRIDAGSEFRGKVTDSNANTGGSWNGWINNA
jgi:hypothetical protein